MGVSTDDGLHWVYSYNLTLTFMTLPQLKQVHPLVIPNNIDSIVKLEFNASSLHELEHLQVHIGDRVFSRFQILNSSFLQIRINQTIELFASSPHEIMLSIDPYLKDWEFSSGKQLAVGGAYIVNQIDNYIQYKEDEKP